MKISKLEVSTKKVSISLHRLKLSTIRRLTGQNKSNNTIKPLHLNNTNLEKVYAPIMNKEEERKASEERSAIDLVQERDAQLLLSLSNNAVLNNKHNEVQQSSEEKNDTKDASIKTHTKPPSKEIGNEKNNAAVIVLDEDSDQDKQKIDQSKEIPLENESLQKEITSIKHKLPVPVPVERKKYVTSNLVQENTPKNNSKIQRKDIEVQTNKVRVVSKDDFELLKIIKVKGLTRNQICRLIRRDQEDTQRGQTEDVNNNSEIPLIDLSAENNPSSNLDQETLLKLTSHSDQNKVLVQKIREVVRKYQLEHRSESSAYQQINVSNIIHEVFAKIDEKCQDAAAKLCFNKTTQTDPKIMQDAGYSMSEESYKELEESNKKDKDKSKQQVQNGGTNNVDVEELMPTIQIQVTQAPMQVDPISPVPGDQASQPLTEQHMQKQYQHALLMRALELGWKQLTAANQQHNNYNNNWNASYVRPAMAQQQPFLATAANSASDEASFPPQQASALNAQAPPSNNQGWQFNQLWVEKNRRLKNPPARNAPYNAGGPRLPTPLLGKYHTMMERQKTQSMIEQQQKSWEQLQNYPNTAWDNYSYPPFWRTLN